MTRFRLRRGGVLPFVCIMLTVLLGAAAMAVDMGRLYATATEAQAAADAAALAAASASQLTPDNDSQNGPLRAQQNAARNRVAGQAATVATADVVPLLYDPSTNTSTTSSYFGTVNAVQVAVRAQARYALAGAIGLAPPTVTRRSTAWIANMNGASCVRPVAPSFTRIYEVDNGLTTRPYSSQGLYAPDLTQQMITQLSPASGTPAVKRTFVMIPPWSNETYWRDTARMPVTGMWHSVNYGNAGWPAFVTNMGAPVGSGACAGETAQVGNYLYPFTWAPKDSATLDTNYVTPGFVQLCNQIGNNGIYDARCRNADGTLGVVARVPLSDSIPDKSGTNFTQKVRMVTQVRIMCYFQSTQASCPATQISNGAGQTIPWQMPSAYAGGPPVDKGYTPGTVVVLLDGPVYTALTRDVVLGNTPSLTQRLILVK